MGGIGPGGDGMGIVNRGIVNKERYSSFGKWYAPPQVIYPDTRTLSYFLIMAEIEWKEVDWSIKE